jgi:hypothetical protein
VLQFSTPLINLLSSIIQINPVLFSIIFTILFTVSKPVGGILFGVVFWLVARSLPINSIARRYFIITSFGIALLFISNQAIIFAYFVYPPFGLVTVSTIGLSSYLFLIGIYASAISVSHDISLRISIKNHALREVEFIESIGTAQMKKEIETKIISITRKNRELIMEETGISPSLTDEDIREYVQKVLVEVQKK